MAIDASLFSLLERNSPLGQAAATAPPDYGPSSPSPYYQTHAEQPPPDPNQQQQQQRDKSADTLAWIGALAQLGAVVGAAMAAKRKKKRSGLEGAVIIPGGESRTAIQIPTEDISQFLPGRSGIGAG